MATEQYTVVALPHSIAADADHHVSLFIAPRLVPDGAEGRLDQFTWFPHWAARLLSDVQFGLRDQLGSIDVSPRLDPIDADVWDAVFGPDTPVKAPPPPDWDGRHWRTFRAAEIHDFAKLAHVVAMIIGPTTPPAPSSHPLTRILDQLGGGGRDDRDRRTYDERIVTAMLDEAVGETGRRRRDLAEIERSIDAVDDPVQRTLMHLHRARRFYERPESATAYQERPTPGASNDPLPRPIPHFAERCAMAGDHPVLQRMLGLVVDLVVDDPARLRRSRWLAGHLAIDGDTSGMRTSRTRCRVAGHALVTVPTSADWRDGRLRIADPERFAILDMDPDGTALKLDRFVMSLPRLAAAARNGDPIHAAPTALRSLGFTAVRHRNATDLRAGLARQVGLRTQLDGSSQPLLSTEDVTQGMRVEVWDDETERWFSLHRRTIDVEVLDHGEVVSGAAEDGFIQGSTATEDPDVDDAPVHVHEAIFGWDGWSLSAPKPGRRVRHDHGREIVEDPADDVDAVTPLVVRPRVADGTLPRLRYGRSYAFRVWATDLAGNSRPHTLAPPSGSDPAASGDGSRLETAVQASLGMRAPAGVRRVAAEAVLRADAVGSIVRRRLDADTSVTAGTTAVTRPPDTTMVVEAMPAELRASGAAEVLADRLVALRDRRVVDPAATVGRAELVANAFADVAADPAHPLITATARHDPRAIAASLTSTAPRPDTIGPVHDRAVIDAEIDTVSPLVPFVRWDPIQPPAIAARHGYTAGESLRRLVIRSGVTQDPSTLEITVTPPDVYAAEWSDLDRRATAQRHLLPPKTSQSEAELHGAFDDAIGSTDPDEHRRLLAVALRENGTLFDVDVVRLDDPTVRDPQPGIALLAGPDVPTAELATLPLPPGDAPFPGQYVVHDTDLVTVPYLPDVLARGISLVFPDAGRDRSLQFPAGVEGLTIRYPGTWPALDPFRLVLDGSPTLDSRLEGQELTIGVPAGHVLDLRLASSTDVDDLDRFGLWRILPAAIRDRPDVSEAAADGWLWAFTPFDDVTLVHAVPRPVAAPRHTIVVPFRAPGSTNVALIGGVELHGPSTDSVTAECRWTDPVDDLGLDGPEDRDRSGVAFTTSIGTGEDLAVLAGPLPDTDVALPVYGPVRLHRAVHEIDDTLHHVVRYRLRASTRFREYFDPPEIAATSPDSPGDPSTPLDDGRSVVGPEIVVDVPSSARPPAPAVHSVIPLFRWDTGEEPEQPAAVRRRRRVGVRIYLERPWFSTGAGELLGVLLAPAANDAELTGLVSQWGSDPVWMSAPVGHRAALSLDHLLRTSGLDDRPGDASPVGRPVTLPLGTVPGAPEVVVLGYEPQYRPDRHLWYADVAITPGDTFWPFVRLAVARYQPSSVAGHHLSAPVTCDFVQLPPERTTSVSRTDVRHVRVVLSGPVGLRSWSGGRTTAGPAPVDATAALHASVAANRTVVARLQRRDPMLPTDLGWETVDAVEMIVRGHGTSLAEVAWVGTLTAPEDLPLRRPGSDDDWRVTVEEWERLPGDPASLAPGVAGRQPVWEQRLVHADEFAL